ncbi:MAG TPA: hypothetical protein VNK91_03365, partial [Burkholderiaceae bacterium]|nr:hypothetical protein [Burkholderiaceae bacterium]
MTDLTLPGAGEASVDPAAALAQLPAVDRLLGQARLAAVIAAYGQALVKRAAQAELALLRERL